MMQIFQFAFENMDHIASVLCILDVSVSFSSHGKHLVVVLVKHVVVRVRNKTKQIQSSQDDSDIKKAA